MIYELANWMIVFLKFFVVKYFMNHSKKCVLRVGKISYD